MLSQRTLPPANRSGGGLWAQFACPTGLLGAVVGWVMARTNAPMERLAAEALDLRSNDRVLEVGFGPGVGIEAIAQRVSDGLVAGVEPSTVMLRQARVRNRKAVRAGRVELQEGSVEALPYAGGTFSKVCAVNSYHLWASPERGLKEIRRVMREGGKLLLCLRMADADPNPWQPPGLTDEEVSTAAERVRQAGFRDVRVERQILDREVACIFGVR